MRLPLKKILTQAKDNYEKAWMETTSYLKKEGHLFDLKPKGKAHPLKEFFEVARKALIDLGFEEMVLPMFVNEEDVYKEYGPEAALILDRLYYLAGLPRPDIGVSNEKINQIEQIIPKFKDYGVNILKDIFRRYKKGVIEADDLLEVLVQELMIEEYQASSLIENVFPEFKDLKPIPTKQTLRSHTTALWFIVLSEIIDKAPLPIQYFIVGPKFRREQKQDATHLYVSNTLSVAIAAEEISLEDGKRIGKEIAKKIGFDNVKVETKIATSKYYAPQTEFEIFGEHPITKEWIEIGDGGFYSPISLAKYGIDIPVLNIGFGCERIVMIKTEETDIRRLVYPYFYKDYSFTDQEIANDIHFINSPKTEKGKEIYSALEKIGLDKKDEKGPIEILAWEGAINKSNVQVYLTEPDDGASLLGRAALNELWVKDGGIESISHGNILEGGVKSRFTYFNGIINDIASKVEDLSKIPNQEKFGVEELRYKMVKRIGEVNLGISEKVRDFITSKSKKIVAKGPVFIGAKIIFKN